MLASLIFVFAVLPLIFATVGSESIASSSHDQEIHNCMLPPHPEHGRYTISNYPSASPGERYSSVKLDISCDTGYLNNDTIKSILCVNGYWSAPMPACVRDLLGFCTLSTDDLRVEYRCLSFPGTLERSWECESLVSTETPVRPTCRFPAYFSFSVLPEMHCRAGMWDYNPICKPACGLTSQHRSLADKSRNHLELPWHAVIYKKSSNNYEAYCGGSLIAATKIISAANCFHDYNDALLPTSNFMVAVNKMYRSYNDTRDRNSQQSEVADIKIPSSYRGYATRYEADIAIVVVKTPFFFHLSARPVCLDLDNNLDITQLTDGNSGKTVVWSVDRGNYQSSDEVLNVEDILYVKNEDSENILSSYGRSFLRKDKFCAMYNNGTCCGVTTSGSGFAFLESTTQRYYLLGVYSDYLVATDDNTRIYTYTSIAKYEDFIKQHL